MVEVFGDLSDSFQQDDDGKDNFFDRQYNHTFDTPEDVRDGAVRAGAAGCVLYSVRNCSEIICDKYAV